MKGSHSHDEMTMVRYRCRESKTDSNKEGKDDPDDINSSIIGKKNVGKQNGTR